MIARGSESTWAAWNWRYRLLEYGIVVPVSEKEKERMMGIT